jgi:hypothetical protein
MSVINQFFQQYRWVYLFSVISLFCNIPNLLAGESNTLKHASQIGEYKQTNTLLSDSSNIRINKQADLLTDFMNNLVLVQIDDNRLIKLSADGIVLSEIGGFGFGTGQFNKPISAATSDGGLNFIVLDSENRRIVRLSSSLNWIDQYPVDLQSGDETIGELTGFTANSTGDIYISDPRNSRILKLDQFGEFQSELLAKGEFLSPGNLAVDGRDYLYVCDKSRGEVAVFDDLGNYISTFAGDVLKSPDVITADDSYIYIGDQTLNSVFIFDLKYKVIGIITGTTSSKKDEHFPTAIVASPTGHLWIAD